MSDELNVYTLDDCISLVAKLDRLELTAGEAAALEAIVEMAERSANEVAGFAMSSPPSPIDARLIAVFETIVSPRDPQSGLPTGKRMHKPFAT